MRHVTAVTVSLLIVTMASNSFAVCPPAVEVGEVTVNVEPPLECFEVDVNNDLGCGEDVILDMRNNCEVPVTHTRGVEGMHSIDNMRCGEEGMRECTTVLAGESAYGFLPVQDSALDIPFEAGEEDVTEHVVSVEYAVSQQATTDSGCSTTGGSASGASAVLFPLLALVGFRRRRS